MSQERDCKNGLEIGSRIDRQFHIDALEHDFQSEKVQSQHQGQMTNGVVLTFEFAAASCDGFIKVLRGTQPLSDEMARPIH